MTEHPKRRFATQLTRGARVLDVGCWNFSFQRFCDEIGATGLVHSGVDSHRPPDAPPPGYTFRQVELDGGKLPFESESFDAVVVSHVMEHLSRPLPLFDEVFRVLKTDGLLYVEAPSNRSVYLPSMPFRFDEYRSTNFFDDPTHVGRPQTPQSLYRLFHMYGAEPVECRYLTSSRVRWRFPWLALRSLVTRDAQTLEHALWWTFGFAVYGIARKRERNTREYVLGNAAAQ